MSEAPNAQHDTSPAIPQTEYSSGAPSWPNRYIWPVLLRILDTNKVSARRVFEIGSGNGATANLLASRG